MTDSKNFASFVKNYESRKQQGKEGLELLNGAENTDTLASATSYFSSFVSSGSDVLQTYLPESVKANVGLVDLEAGESTDVVEQSWNELSRSDRFKGVIILWALSAFFFLLASFFLPMAALTPQKFIFSFTLGSIFFMASFALLQGPKDFCKGLVTSERLPFTIAYFLSIFGTIFSCLVWRTYLTIFLFSSIQMVSLAYYAATYLPGGRFGLKILVRVAKSLFWNACVPCFKLIVSMFQKLFA